jgi:hypothetical protein
MDLVLGWGVLNSLSVSQATPVGQGTPVNTGIQYGWMDYKLSDMSLQIGHIATNIGYESAVGFRNAQITRGIVWSAQPTYYPGIRINKPLNDLQAYAEFTNDGPNRQAAAFGASGSSGDTKFSLSYYDQKSGTNIVDVIVSLPVSGMEMGINLDYLMLDSSGANQDDNALGVAVFAAVNNNGMTIPIRVEVMQDGTSGLYGGVDNSLTLTVTPTKKIGKNAFIRTEVAFSSTKNKVFADNDGNTKDSQILGAVEAGLTF